MDVVGELLGVPPADRDSLRNCADTVVHREEGRMDIPPAAMQATGQLLAYFRELVAQRQRQPGSDLASALVAAEVDGERLQEGDVLAFLFLMVIAGNETTTKLIGNALYWLWKNPRQRERVRRDVRLVPNWVEETLRYDGSTQMLARTATRSVELRGQRLAEGDRLLLLIGAANRDERVFADPDRFDLDRPNSRRHLGFATGSHTCLGSHLAKAEARIALDTLLARLPGLALDRSSTESPSGYEFRQPRRLSVHWSRS